VSEVLYISPQLHNYSEEQIKYVT